MQLRPRRQRENVVVVEVDIDEEELPLPINVAPAEQPNAELDDEELPDLPIPIYVPPAERPVNAELEAFRALRRQQDIEYEVGRRADLLRQQIRQAEEREAQELAQERVAREERRQHDLQELAEMKRTAETRLPPEDGPSSVLVRFVLPDGRRLQRRFPLQSDVSVLYLYAFVQGFGDVTLNIPMPNRRIPQRGATLEETIGRRAVAVMVTVGEDVPDDCAICRSDRNNEVFSGILECGHRFHYHCVNRLREAQEADAMLKRCPICRNVYNRIERRPNNL